MPQQNNMSPLRKVQLKRADVLTKRNAELEARNFEGVRRSNHILNNRKFDPTMHTSNSTVVLIAFIILILGGIVTTIILVLGRFLEKNEKKTPIEKFTDLNTINILIILLIFIFIFIIYYNL